MDDATFEAYRLLVSEDTVERIEAGELDDALSLLYRCACAWDVSRVRRAVRARTVVLSAPEAGE